MARTSSHRSTHQDHIPPARRANEHPSGGRAACSVLRDPGTPEETAGGASPSATLPSRQLEDLAAAVAEPPSSTDEAERQVAHALAVAAESALSDIDDALQRFHSGGYGKCEHCAARIPFERLEALPMARFCMPCQYRKETSRLPQRTWSSAQWPSS